MPQEEQPTELAATNGKMLALILAPSSTYTALALESAHEQMDVDAAQAQVGGCMHAGACGGGAHASMHDD